MASVVRLYVLCVVVFVQVYIHKFSFTFDMTSVSSRCTHTELSQIVHDQLVDVSV